MSNNSDHDNTLTHADDAIDALARQAGAEVRRPAPEGLADGVRKTRRRQQTMRAGIAGAGLTAIIAIGVVALTTGDDKSTVVPATEAPGITDAPNPTTPTPTTPTSDPSIAGPTIPPIGHDADGIPDGIYTPADETMTLFDVFDPATLELRETIPGSFTPSVPRSGGVSASGGVTYVAPGTNAEHDACGQTRITDWVDGVDVSGLPQWVTQLVISADGQLGAVITAACPTDGGSPTAVYDSTVAVFDPDQPTDVTHTVFTVDGSEATGVDSLELSDDGSYMLLTTTPRPLTEGNARQIRIIDTATGEVVAAIGADQTSDLPRTDCGLGFVSMDFVSSTSIAYAAICPDGLAVVIRDLATGETLEVLQPEYAGRTYETMTSASMVVDRSTFNGPSSAWFLLCASRETALGDGTLTIDAPGSHPCWIGHGDQAMREIPTNTTIGAWFQLS